MGENLAQQQEIIVGKHMYFLIFQESTKEKCRPNDRCDQVERMLDEA